MLTKPVYTVVQMAILQMGKITHVLNAHQIVLLVLIIINKEILIFAQAVAIKVHTYKLTYSNVLLFALLEHI